MRPTTKDLAQRAGVSLATVDRVLNGRPGVRADTVAAVNEAAQALGFVRNLSAANLARQRHHRFRFLLPERGDEFLDTITSAVEEAGRLISDHGMSVECRRALPDDPHAAATYLGRIHSGEVEGIALMSPLSPQLRDAKRRLEERGIKVVQLASGVTDPDPYTHAGIDNAAAGRTVARLMGRFIGPRRGKVIVLTETLRALDSSERRRGFDAVMHVDFPELEVLATLETHGESARLSQVLENICTHANGIVGLYVMSAEAAPALRAIEALPRLQDATLIAHELTPTTERLLRQGRLDALIVQDPGHLVRSALRILRARCDGTALVASQEAIRIEILLRENLGRRTQPEGQA